MAGAEVEIGARTKLLREKAHALGFQGFGVARADSADPEGRLRDWLARGHGGVMRYLADTVAEREDPRALLPGAKSVIALALSYYVPGNDPEPPLKIARYARGDDYHRILRKRVRRLRRYLLELAPGERAHPALDTSPVMEKVWAERAGVAWIGKSTLAISQSLGTYTFLAVIVTTAELAYDSSHTDHCGSCTLCLDACPTQAFPQPYVLDATRCITYWTIEHRDPFTAQTPPLHGWVAGCDVCQEVCPFNKFAVPTPERRLSPRPALARPDPALFADPAREAELSQALVGTALAFAGAPAIQRNALRVLAEADVGSGGDPTP